jgi:hypothetical protein
VRSACHLSSSQSPRYVYLRRWRSFSLSPSNQATNNWTQIPANWEHLRWQWEVSHAVNAANTFVGFCSLTISTLLARE